MSNGQGQRSSIFGGLLLILLGAFFLLARFDPNLGVWHLFSRYWPVVIILWGLAKLIDHPRSAACRARTSSATERKRSCVIGACFLGRRRDGHLFQD